MQTCLCLFRAHCDMSHNWNCACIIQFCLWHVPRVWIAPYTRDWRYFSATGWQNLYLPSYLSLLDRQNTFRQFEKKILIHILWWIMMRRIISCHLIPPPVINLIIWSVSMCYHLHSATRTQESSIKVDIKYVNVRIIHCVYLVDASILIHYLDCSHFINFNIDISIINTF